MEIAPGPGLTNQTDRSERKSAELCGDIRRGIRAATSRQGGQVDRSTAGCDDFPGLLRDVDGEHRRRGSSETSGPQQRQSKYTHFGPWQKSHEILLGEV
jgi:hypothetical protein